MSVHPPPEPGFCVCGRRLPDDPLSDWACSEPCQSAWMHHHANPEYPHPREIREAAEAAARRRAAGVAVAPTAGVAPIANGTEVNVNGQAFVRIGTHWQPAGMWTPMSGGLADRVRYLRWCPQCQRRVESLLYPASEQQECGQCGYAWPGRPLLGQVQSRGEPWPGIRLRLFDGHRSVVATFSQEATQMLGDQLPGMLGRTWLRLERQLCGGYADMDQPDERQRCRQRRRLAGGWHLPQDVSP